MRRKTIAHPLAVLALAGSLTVACGDRPIGESTDDDGPTISGDPGQLMMGLRIHGGFTSTPSFQEDPYGWPFYRLYGDGTFYYGAPTEVMVKKLDPSAANALLRQARPDLWKAYQQEGAYYPRGAPTDQCDFTLETTAAGEEVAVSVYGGALMEDVDYSTVPEPLLDALHALDAAGQGGAPFEPTVLQLQVELVEQSTLSSLDQGGIRDWTLPTIDLYQQSQQKSTFAVQSAAEIKQLSALLPKSTSWSFDTSAFFRQDGRVFSVLHFMQLP